MVPDIDIGKNNQLVISTAQLVQITGHVDKTCLSSLLCGLYTHREGKGHKSHLFIFMFEKLITLVTRSYPFYL